MMRRIGPIVTVLVGAALAASACGGGGKKEPVEPGDDAEGGGEVTDDGSDGMVPPERMDAITNDLNRKRQSATRCLTEAIDAGEADKNARGRVTLEFVITSSGDPRDVKVIEASLESKMVQDCVVDIVSKMNFGELPRDLDWSYTFAFEAF